MEVFRLAPLGHPAKSLPSYQSRARPPVGSDVGVRREIRSQVWNQRRLAACTVFRGIRRRRLIQAAWLLRARFYGPRDGCRVKA